MPKSKNQKNFQIASLKKEKNNQKAHPNVVAIWNAYDSINFFLTYILIDNNEKLK